MPKRLQKCSVCGITSDVKTVIYRSKCDAILCDKHWYQMRTKGRITDPTPRSCFDKNDYWIVDDVVYMNLYNRKGEIVDTVKFDKWVLEDLKNRKWRPVWKPPHYYAETIGNKSEGVSHVYMHRVIMELAGYDISHCEVDHINGDTMDNRLCNLRVADRQLQMFNVTYKTSGKIPVRGVSFNKDDNTYVVNMIVRKHRYYVKHFLTVEEAVYARFLLEKALIGPVATNRHYDNFTPYVARLSAQQKADIETYIDNKLIDWGVDAVA